MSTKCPNGRPIFDLAVLALLACVALTFLFMVSPANAAEPGSELLTPSQGLLQLGPGDSVTVQVYGQPDMTNTVYVGDDGKVPVALVGAVQVNGLSPSEAAKQIERALRDGNYLVDPHVTLTVVQTRSQRVTVIGEVRTPGRYAVESNTTVLDLLAQAGGTTEASSDVVYVLRPLEDGKTDRIAVHLDALRSGRTAEIPAQRLRGGDSVLVPRADQFSIIGEVHTPSVYRLDTGMTIIEAIARAGGLTPLGSSRRIEVKRRMPDGTYVTRKAKLADLVEPNDVIRVKESIF